jgi:hypothetical protein
MQKRAVAWEIWRDEICRPKSKERKLNGGVIGRWLDREGRGWQV